LYLVRHAETEANVGAVWHGTLDAPLTARGQRQVAATALVFAGMAAQAPFSVIYTSPLGRARTTAGAIADAIAQTSTPATAAQRLQIDPELSEFTIGDWEGRSFDDLRTVERMWERWATDPTFAPPNGESPASFNRRALAALRRISANRAGERMIVVTHGGFICNVLAVWLGSGPADWRRYEVHNCSITVLQGSGDRWQPLAVNDTCHLAPDLVAQHDSSAWNRE
ncbi:MAG: histidine phosphatase family protein, partial [Caldilineaceae bacterium]